MIFFVTLISCEIMKAEAFITNPTYVTKSPTVWRSVSSDNYLHSHFSPFGFDRSERISSLSMAKPSDIQKHPIQKKAWQSQFQSIVQVSLISTYLLISTFTTAPDALAESFISSVAPTTPTPTTSVKSEDPIEADEARTRAIVSNALSTSSTSTKGQKTDPNLILDEVWTIVGKYYIDRSFHSQDWEKVLSEYHDKLSKESPSTQTDPKFLFKLTTQMVQSLGDKYSRMLDAGAYASIQKFDLIGVGATFMPDSDKKVMVGAPPIPGSAADLAGMKYGDYLDAVNGVSTKGRTALDITDQVADDPNAKEVTMTMRRQGANDLPGEGVSRDVVLQRSFSEVKDPIKYKLTEKRADGTNVGYVRINEFNSLVKRQLAVALEELEKQGANAYVLDLRGNPGGAFQSAVEVASFFMDDTVATYVVDNNQEELPFRTAKGKVIINESSPISIWVDRRSASASEVLAGALHDNCRGVVMGENSFGKGLIQAVYGLKDGSGLVLTVARYVTPNGTDIQGSGIKPDLTDGVPGSLIPGVTIINGDTGKIDFNAVKAKSQEMCAAK